MSAVSSVNIPKASTSSFAVAAEIKPFATLHRPVTPASPSVADSLQPKDGGIRQTGNAGYLFPHSEHTASSASQAASSSFSLTSEASRIASPATFTGTRHSESLSAATPRGQKSTEIPKADSARALATSQSAVQVTSESVRQGTGGIDLPPYREPDKGTPCLTDEYQTITCHVVFSNYSLEELRLADYLNESQDLCSNPVVNVVNGELVSPHGQSIIEGGRVVGRARLQL
jgi:hypothetical protein